MVRLHRENDPIPPQGLKLDLFFVKKAADDPDFDFAAGKALQCFPAVALQDRNGYPRVPPEEPGKCRGDQVISLW